jgi:D-tyrosyl-tRNA(Tyr) deacylase
MKAWLQRVREASVTVGGDRVAEIGRGLLVLLGVAPDDTPAAADKIAARIAELRLFEDAAGRINLSLEDVGGDVIVVSQFTLYADCRKGNRPAFVKAAGPELGNRLYEYFCSLAAAEVPCGKGIFGADMQVSLVNDGPVTIWLDTDDLQRPKRG